MFKFNGAVFTLAIILSTSLSAAPEGARYLNADKALDTESTLPPSCLTIDWPSISHEAAVTTAPTVTSNPEDTDRNHLVSAHFLQDATVSRRAYNFTPHSNVWPSETDPGSATNNSWNAIPAAATVNINATTTPSEATLSGVSTEQQDPNWDLLIFVLLGWGIARHLQNKNIPEQSQEANPGGRIPSQQAR